MWLNIINFILLCGLKIVNVRLFKLLYGMMLKCVKIKGKSGLKICVNGGVVVGEVLICFMMDLLV